MRGRKYEAVKPILKVLENLQVCLDSSFNHSRCIKIFKKTQFEGKLQLPNSPRVYNKTGHVLAKAEDLVRQLQIQLRGTLKHYLTTFIPSIFNYFFVLIKIKPAFADLGRSTAKILRFESANNRLGGNLDLQ
jgi:hypothetical protein